MKLVIASRLVRRLCEACKLGYQPDPQVLRKLNLDPNKVTKLYQARTEPARDPKGEPMPCEFCQELHYKGRIGMFEVMVVDDAIKQAILRKASPTELRTLFRKNKGMLMQEAALEHVQSGITSVQEVRRVLQGPAPAGPGRPAASASPK